MDRNSSKKRGREAETAQQRRVSAVATAAAKLSKKKEHDDPTPDLFSFFDEGVECDVVGGVSDDDRRPMGLFEFPWQKGGRLQIPDPDGWDLRDVFFSSLVDGCSAAIGIPGDRLLQTTEPGPIDLSEISESWPSDGEVDGVDSIWSSVLRQPLSTSEYSKGENA